MAHTKMFQFETPVQHRHDLGGIMRVWVPIILVITTIEAMAVPLRIVLGQETMPVFAGLDAVIMLLFIFDAAVNFSRMPRPASRTAWLFLLADLIAAIPFHLLFGWFPLVFLRLIKLLRVAHWMAIWRQLHFTSWNVLRLVYFVYWLALSVHWLAIGGLALRGLPPAADGLAEYLHSLYWCVSTLTTIGYVDIKPTTNIEFVYAMAVMIFGVGMYGYVIANVSTIIVNLQPARVRYLENMEKLGAFMRYRGIPGGLQHRIRDYYAYIWEQRLGYDESSIIQGLPPGLLADVSLFLKRDVIQKVPFFQGASEDLIREIALVMRPVVYTPGDTVFHAGEPGGEMYFISHGRLQVIGRDDRTVLATLSDGEFFGEMALLLNQPRNATVKAMGYCDLYLLAKPGFDAIVERYPEFAAHIHEMMAGRREGRH